MREAFIRGGLEDSRRWQPRLSQRSKRGDEGPSLPRSVPPAHQHALDPAPEHEVTSSRSHIASSAAPPVSALPVRVHGSLDLRRARERKLRVGGLRGNESSDTKAGSAFGYGGRFRLCCFASPRHTCGSVSCTSSNASSETVSASLKTSVLWNGMYLRLKMLISSESSSKFNRLRAYSTDHPLTCLQAWTGASTKRRQAEAGHAAAAGMSAQDPGPPHSPLHRLSIRLPAPPPLTAVLLFLAPSTPLATHRARPPHERRRRHLPSPGQHPRSTRQPWRLQMRVTQRPRTASPHPVALLLLPPLLLKRGRSPSRQARRGVESRGPRKTPPAWPRGCLCCSLAPLFASRLHLLLSGICRLDRSAMCTKSPKQRRRSGFARGPREEQKERWFSETPSERGRQQSCSRLRPAPLPPPDGPSTLLIACWCDDAPCRWCWGAGQTEGPGLPMRARWGTMEENKGGQTWAGVAIPFELNIVQPAS